MQFGVRQGDAPATQQNDSGAAGGSYIKYFKDGGTTLRFLEEFDDWTKVWMHFSQSKTRDYPCIREQGDCPGCAQENPRESKASGRWIVNALNEETGYVDLYKVPYSLIEDVMRNADKFGTLLDRDYTVYKKKNDTGQTSYSLDREDKAPMDLSQYQSHMKNHQEALADAFREVWGGLPGEDGYTGDLLLQLAAPKEPTWSGDDSPPSEPAVQKDEEQREISEAELRIMDVDQLIRLYREADVPVPAFSDKDDLVTGLITALS